MLIFALLFTLALSQTCQSCNKCPPESGKCSCACSDLQAAFDNRNPINLIVQGNVTMTNKNNGEQSFLVRIFKTYQGSGSGDLFEILPQPISAPCFTNWDLNQPYIFSIPWHPSRITIKDEQPDCFYVDLNRCDYFKLYDALTPQELQILAKHEHKHNVNIILQ